GLIIALVVHAADIQDRDGARWVLKKLVTGFPRLQLIWADSGYRGQLIDWAKRLGGWTAEIVRRVERHRFVVLPRRWVVERTFGWFGHYRRLSKDYETLPQSSEAVVYLAMINLMVHRLKPG